MLKFLLIICFIPHIILAQERQFAPPEYFGCPQNFKTNTIGEFQIHNENYFSIVNREKYFVLYVTASWCDYCCQTEVELFELRKILHNKNINGHDIKIITLFSDKNPDPIREYKLSLFKIPTIYFVKETQFFQYGGFVKADNIFKFINNIVNPVVELNTVEEVQQFMDTSVDFVEKNDLIGNHIFDIKNETDFHIKNRMVAFFSDIEDYSAEYSTFLSISEKISYRYDLRIGIVNSKEIVEYFKKINDGVWFNSHSWNSVVVKRNKKEFFLDLSLMSEHLENFMIYNTICNIEELSMNSNHYMTKISTPIVTFFIDSSVDIKTFHVILKSFIDLAEKYLGYYIMVYIDGNTKTSSKAVFGYGKDKPQPHIVINYIQSGKQKHYPTDKEMETENVYKFLDENINVFENDLEQLKEKQIKSFDEKIMRNLRLTTKVSKKDLNEVLNNKKYDVVLFIVDTDYDTYSENISKYYHRTIERFKALGMRNVLFASYDINENGVLIGERFITDKGYIYLFPAHSKNPILFNQNISVLRLMKWIESNSEIKFRLPETPNIDLELHEEYYKRKSILESYDENMNKNDFEIDDMIKMDFVNSVEEITQKVEL